MDIQGAITRLQHMVLAWDYWEMWDNSKQQKGMSGELTKVPDTFESVEQYISIYEALILEECSAVVVRGSMEGEYVECHESVVAARQAMDEWTYVRMTLKPGVSKHFRGGNLVLLSKDHPDDKNPRREFHAMGIVESNREGEQSVRLKFYLDPESQAGNESGVNRVELVGGELQPNSCWYVCSLASLATITREWVALQHVHTLAFRDILLSAKPRARKPDKHLEVPPSMKQKMDTLYNKSQIEALHAGLDGTPLVLIQGPPGTGKTHAILGLLSIILHAIRKGSLELIDTGDDVKFVDASDLSEVDSFRLYSKQAPWVISQPVERDRISPVWESDVESDPDDDCYGLLDWDSPMVIGKELPKGARILVCAPSNSALDEIMYRIVHSGLMDRDGSYYTPNVLRVGVNIHHSVESISLDAVTEVRIAQSSKPGTSVLEKDRLRIQLIEEADIVGCTLSFSGSALFRKLTCKFDVVVVDEAAQAVEPSTLIPLMNGARQVYLVGDPVQLPATVLSQRAQEYEYSKSLFKRLMKASYPVHMLNVQYRMNPAISAFASREFYEGKLMDDESVVKGTESGWHEFPCFGPFAFFHVEGKEVVPDGSTSKINEAEVDFIIALYRELTHRFPDLKTRPAVAVITPYSGQVKLFREIFEKAFGEEVSKMVDVNSIDGFQGRQKDITFFSTVRSKECKNVGFVADEHRINVGITRARCSLLIVGNADALMHDIRWRRLALTAKTSGCYYMPKRPYNTYIESAINGDVGPLDPTPAHTEALEKANRGEMEELDSDMDKQAEQLQRANRGRGRGRGRRGRGRRFRGRARKKKTSQRS